MRASIAADVWTRCMDSERKTRAKVELPVDDGVIERALTELDAKLSTWLDAMRAAARTRCEPASAVAEVAPAPDVTPEPAARAVEPEEPVAPEAEVAPDGPAGEVAPEASEAVAPAATRLMQGTRPAPVDEPPVTAGAEPVSAEEDEALLASLDEKTRAAVLIRRRLYGKTKSVRELLDDISRLGLAQDESKPQSKRWWRR